MTSVMGVSIEKAKKMLQCTIVLISRAALSDSPSRLEKSFDLPSGSFDVTDSSSKVTSVSIMSSAELVSAKDESS